jgi:uncharacterized membrane protein YfcA
MQEIYLVLVGLIAGAIDSIAGGGGLITLPVLTNYLEPGAHAIGSNKIVGFTGAFIAFLVYWRHQKLPLKKGLIFLVMIGVGSILGSLTTPHLPRVVFQYLLLAVCPVVLWVLWKKNTLIQELSHHQPHSVGVLVATGIGVGFYDGFFGPGGGTFMLLGLLWAVRLPLFEALLLSKLANTISAGVSLVSYAGQGYVHWAAGATVASGMLVGGYYGAKFATKRAEKIVRPVLAIVVVLLLVVQVRALVAG